MFKGAARLSERPHIDLGRPDNYGPQEPAFTQAKWAKYFGWNGSPKARLQERVLRRFSDLRAAMPPRHRRFYE
jgi:hypothetical protein